MTRNCRAHVDSMDQESSPVAAKPQLQKHDLDHLHFIYANASALLAARGASRLR